MEISIITATYNSEETILDSINSVKNQTFKGIKHLIVDGVSGDNTVKIVYENKHDNLEIISEKDEGIFDAYNKGISICDTEIIGILNSDDFYPNENVITDVMNAFKNPNIDAVYGDLAYVSYKDSTTIKRVWKSPKVNKLDFSRDRIPPHPSLFVRKSVYRSVGVFEKDFHYSGDFDFMVRVFSANKRFEYIPNILVHMRDGGRTGGNLKDVYFQNLEIYRSLKDHSINFNIFKFVISKVINRIKQKFFALIIKN